MTDVTELVDLPDAATRPLVHPLDLAETSGRYRRGWLLGVLASPAVGLLVGVIAWRLGAGYVVPVVAGGSLAIIGAVVARYHRDETCGYIPRRRQDRGRVLPAPWELLAGVVVGAAMATSAALAAPALASPDIPAEVREFVAGGAVAVGVLVALDLAASLILGRGSYVGRPWFALPVASGVLVGAGVAIGAFLPPGSTVLAPDALLGLAMILLVGVVTAVWQVVRGRRPEDA